MKDASDRYLQHARWLFVVLACVVLGFVTSTVAAAIRIRAIDSYVSTIVSNAMPSVRHLTEARSDLHDLDESLRSYARASQSDALSSRDSLNNDRRNLQAHLADYLALPAFPDERAAYDEVDAAVGEVERSVTTVLLGVDERNWAAMDLSLHEEQRQSDRADAAMARLVDFNAAAGQRLGLRVNATRSSAMWTTIVLNAMVGGLAAVAMFLSSLALRRLLRDARLTQSELRQSEERYSALFEASPFPLALARMPERITVAANQAFLDLFEVSMGQVIDQKSVNVGISDPASQNEVVAKLWEHGHVRNFECTRWTKAGSPVHLSLSLDRVDIRGQEHVLTTIQDVTVRKAQEAALARAMQDVERALASETNARRDAEAANLLKDEFLATMSHELRTPLNAILGWSSLLRKQRYDVKASERAIATIERNAKVQVRLIEDVLDVSRIITGKLKLDLQRVDLNAITRAAIDVVRPAAEAKGVALVIDLPLEDSWIVGDAGRLQQVVWNLLSNATKFTPPRGTVTVRLERSGGALRIVVRDTGPGIAPEHQPFIFQRFRQADSSTTREHGGLGLGLAIVRHLVDLHGGSVTVDSAPGHGATFTVTLPIRALHQGDANAGTVARIDETSVISLAPPSLEGISVLVVDDDEDSRSLLDGALSPLGAVVALVDSGQAALEHLARHEVAVLISDIGMPREDGFSLIRRIRHLPPDQGGELPAIALTAYASGEDAARAIQAGYQVHIAKPADIDTLVRTVARLAANRCRDRSSGERGSRDD